MTLQYEQRNINLQGAQAVSTLIFNSNSTVQSDIIFNDWDALLTKAQEIPGIKEIIIADGALNVIPAGTYDMTDIRLVGESAFASVSVDGVTFENLTYVDSLTITAGSTADNVVSTFSYVGDTVSLTLINSTFSIGGLSTVPMFDVTAASVLTITSRGSSFLSANPAVPLIAVDATSSIFAQAGVRATGGSSWGGALGSSPFVDVAVGGTFVLTLGTGDVFWAQDQANGPTSVLFLDDYEAANVADWNGTEPESVQNALDRIAAALGPIA